MRSLDRLASLKLRLGVIIVIGVGAAVSAVSVGRGLNLGWAPSALLGTSIALMLVQLVARGTTKPLRDMASAAEALAGGDYSQRVHTNARDEVGQLAKSFNSMADELASVERFRRDLIANASHELRTPIAVARAVLENLVDGVQPATPETLRPVLGQVERLSRLVDQLLDLSRLEAGTIPFDLAEFRVEGLLTEVAEAARIRGLPGTQSIVVDVEPDVQVFADDERLRQVLTNLVDNAVRHNAADGVIKIRARMNRGGSEITVSDDGPGIPKEEAVRVFERFTRLDAARSRDAGGAGLGLAIVKWIVDQHGGTIKAEPTRDSDPTGCTMRVWLPMPIATGQLPEHVVGRRQERRV